MLMSITTHSSTIKQLCNVLRFLLHLISTWDPPPPPPPPPPLHQINSQVKLFQIVCFDKLFRTPNLGFALNLFKITARQFVLRLYLKYNSFKLTKMCDLHAAIFAYICNQFWTFFIFKSNHLNPKCHVTLSYPKTELQIIYWWGSLECYRYRQQRARQLATDSQRVRQERERQMDRWRGNEKHVTL